MDHRAPDSIRLSLSSSSFLIYLDLFLLWSRGPHYQEAMVCVHWSRARPQDVPRMGPARELPPTDCGRRRKAPGWRQELGSFIAPKDARSWHDRFPPRASVSPFIERAGGATARVFKWQKGSSFTLKVRTEAPRTSPPLSTCHSQGDAELWVCHPGSGCPQGLPSDGQKGFQLLRGGGHLFCVGSTSRA